MKTAISIPDDIFADAERLARALKKSRSQLYSRAIKEFVSRHADDEVTEALDRICDEMSTSETEFSDSAAKHTLENTEW